MTNSPHRQVLRDVRVFNSASGHLGPACLLVDGVPTTSLAVLTAPETGIRLLMQGGRTLRQSL